MKWICAAWLRWSFISSRDLACEIKMNLRSLKPLIIIPVHKFLMKCLASQNINGSSKPVFHHAEYSARSGKPIVFHRILPKAYAEKSDKVQLFSRRKFRKPIILLTLRTTWSKQIYKYIPSSRKPADPLLGSLFLAKFCCFLHCFLIPGLIRDWQLSSKLTFINYYLIYIDWATS